MAKDLAIILNNGSVNSAVVTALAVQRYRPVLLYAESPGVVGGRARAGYDLQIAHFKPYREHSISLAAPTSGVAHAAAAAANDPRSSTPLAPKMLEMLPLISTAARFAAQYQASAIYFGLRVGPESAELAQATEYVAIWNEMLQLPCGQGELELLTPLLELEPWQVIDLAFQVAAPLEKTWSCTEDTGDPCWACRGCRDREAAFIQAGKPDPLRAVKKT
jgi:Queuosine biosynthesis protein QueC